MREDGEMKTDVDPRIVAADRVENSLIVTFGDGVSAVFSAALLHSMLPQAEKIEAQDSEEE